MGIVELQEERIRVLEGENADLRLDLASAVSRTRISVEVWGKALGMDASCERVPETLLARETRALKARLAAAEAEVARYRAAERVEQRGGYIHLRSVA